MQKEQTRIVLLLLIQGLRKTVVAPILGTMKFLGALAIGVVCLATASAAYPNPITDDEMVSVITKSIDPFFYQVASEVGTDKVSQG